MNFEDPVLEDMSNKWKYISREVQETIKTWKHVYDLGVGKLQRNMKEVPNTGQDQVSVMIMYCH